MGKRWYMRLWRIGGGNVGGKGGDYREGGGGYREREGEIAAD